MKADEPIYTDRLHNPVYSCVDLKNEKSDSVEFKSAAKFVTHCLYKLEGGDIFIEGNTSKTNFRLLGAGSPKREVEV